MIKALTKVGNSHAVIIPAHMIIKYKLGKKIMIEETENGILIHALQKPQKETLFQKKLRKLRENKAEIKRQMRQDANEPGIHAYYSNPKNTFDDVDPDIID